MNIGVIFAGGTGSRMHSKEKPKQFLMIHGKPIIIHTIEIFEHHPQIDSVVVSCIEAWIPYFKELLVRYNIKKVKKVVKGGNTGQDSIYNALCGAEEISDGEKSIVLIHDGVRPLITEKTISDSICSVMKYGSAITSVQVKETVLFTDGYAEIEEVVDRDRSRLARAPQGFWLDKIISTHRQAIEENRHDFIDSCSLMQHYGSKMHLIDGPQENIKITTPDDFYVLRAILDAKENMQIYGIDS